MRLDEVVLRALEKEPERRYQQASEIKTEVENIAATPLGPPSRAAGDSPANSSGTGRTAAAQNAAAAQSSADEAAIERNRRMKPARPATEVQWATGIAALILCFIAIPACLHIIGPASGTLLALIGMIMAIEAVAFLLALIGWRSLAGKTAAILAAIVLIVLCPVLVAGLVNTRHEFGNRRSLADVTADVAAHNNLGLTFATQGQPDQAIGEYLGSKLEIQPDDAEAHVNLGKVLASMGRFDEAVAQYRKALEIKPNFAEASDNMAKALASRAKPGQRTTPASAVSPSSSKAKPPSVNPIADLKALQGQ